MRLKQKLIKVKWQVLVAAIIALTIIEVVALFNGIDGTLMLMVIGSIAGIAGVHIDIKEKKK